MQKPSCRDDFGLVETCPPLPGRLIRHRRRRNKAISTTHDLVEPMHYVYVSVLEAKDLPGSLHPYVVVKLDSYKAVTKHLEKNANQNPAWRQTFAFAKEAIQSNLLRVIVKNKHHAVKNEFVGRVPFDLSQLPLHSPLVASQWYELEDKKGQNVKGEILLAVWMGTQEDTAYCNARHSDTLNLTQESVAHTRSHVYYSPKLCYLRLHIIEAQDLESSDKDRVSHLVVKIQLGSQLRLSRPCRGHSVNPIWNEEFMFVVSEPSHEYLVLTVEDQAGPNQSEPLGLLTVPVSTATMRLDHQKIPPSKWFKLDKPSSTTIEEGGEEEVKFSRIHLRLCLDTGYHVQHDDWMQRSGDLQPWAKALQKSSIGILELGILSARNLTPVKTKEGRCIDAYCVAKYGSKWVRTRTVLDTLSPRWNEPYTWEIYDPCTFITVAVFDNCQIFHNKDNNAPRDQRIGKVRIQISTLEMNRIYTHFYPLLLLQPSGLKKTGQLHLALRFTCNSWMNMVTLYSKPLVPKMHYMKPIPFLEIKILQHHAMRLIAEKLARSEPPLRKEVIEYMLEVYSSMWSMRRFKANLQRITSVVSGVLALGRWFNQVRSWKNPVTTSFVHVVFFLFVCYPGLILPTIFLYLFLIGVWTHRFRPRNPPHIDITLSHAEAADLDELDEEFDTFPTTRPIDIVNMRYAGLPDSGNEREQYSVFEESNSLRGIAGRLQAVAGDLAAMGERVHAIIRWYDRRATAIFLFFLLVLAISWFMSPYLVCAIAVLYFLRPLWFDNGMPSLPLNFFQRLPAKWDAFIEPGVSSASPIDAFLESTRGRLGETH